MRRWIMIAVLVVVGLRAGELAAQYQPFDGLRPGQTVRVRMVGGQRFDTRLGAAGDSTADLPASRVDSVWVRGRAVVTGAIVGAAIAGPATFAFFLALCNAFGDGECSEIGLVAAYGLAAGAGGALIGAGIGWMIPKWRLRYARDRDATVGLLLAPGRVGVAARF
jgi:hypothetical protein